MREAESAGCACTINQIGSMFTIFFTDRPQVCDYQDAKSCDTSRFARFFLSMLDEGIYLPPSQFETAFLSAAMTEDQVESFVVAARAALRRN
jgi:glutamate-1-semialdehyde 2,1-aminomutase